MRLNIFTLLILIGQISLAQECFPDWAYYRSVSINNPSTESMLDGQVSFALDTKSLVDSSKLASNGADLRIVDAACNSIPFVLLKAAEDSGNTVWIKLDALPAEDSIILHIYYGNDTAENVANGDDVFLFYDNFSADTINPAKWEAIGGFNTWRVNAGIMEYGSSSEDPDNSRFKFIRTKPVFDEEVVFNFNARISNSNGFGFSSTDSILDRIIFRQSGFGFDTMNQVAFNDDTLSNGTSISQAYPFIRYPRGEYRDAEIRAGLDGNILVLTRFANLNDSSINSDTLKLTQSPMSGFHFILSSFINANIYLDYIWVRKEIPEAINATLGEEEVLIRSSLNPNSLAQKVKVYPNPSTGTIHLNGLAKGHYSLQLFNSIGQTVQTGQALIANQRTIDFAFSPHIPNGPYWLMVKDDNGFTATFKATLLR